jgi:hypothetical protein
MNHNTRPHADELSASGEASPARYNPEPETRNAKLLSAVHTRTGKIARLPENVRLSVNQLLRNGAKYSAISAHLAELGYPGISPTNICHWKHGGFLDWYREAQAREALVAPLNALDHCTRSSDITRWQQNTLSFLAEKFASIIANFDHTRFIELLNERPELFPQCVAAIASVSRSASQLTRSFDLLRPHEASLRAELSLPEPDSLLLLDPDDSPSAQTETRNSQRETRNPEPEARNPTLLSEESTIESAHSPTKNGLAPTTNPEPLIAFSQIKPDSGKFSQFQREKLIQPGIQPAPTTRRL